MLIMVFETRTPDYCANDDTVFWSRVCACVPLVGRGGNGRVGHRPRRSSCVAQSAEIFKTGAKARNRDSKGCTHEALGIEVIERDSGDVGGTMSCGSVKLYQGGEP